MYQELGGKWRVRALLEYGLSCFSGCAHGDTDAWLVALVDFMILVETTAAELRDKPQQRRAGVAGRDDDAVSEPFEEHTECKHHPPIEQLHTRRVRADRARGEAPSALHVRGTAHSKSQVRPVQQQIRGHSGEVPYLRGANHSTKHAGGAPEGKAGWFIPQKLWNWSKEVPYLRSAAQSTHHAFNTPSCLPGACRGGKRKAILVATPKPIARKNVRGTVHGKAEVAPVQQHTQADGEEVPYLRGATYSKKNAGGPPESMAGRLIQQKQQARSIQVPYLRGAAQSTHSTFDTCRCLPGASSRAKRKAILAATPKAKAHKKEAKWHNVTEPDAIEALADEILAGPAESHTLPSNGAAYSGLSLVRDERVLRVSPSCAPHLQQYGEPDTSRWLCAPTQKRPRHMLQQQELADCD